MRSLTTLNRCLLAAALFLLPSAVFASDIQVNGVCITGQGLGGNCPPPAGSSDAVGISPAPTSTSGSGSTNIVVAPDTDPYTVAWTYSASYSSGVTLVFDPTVTYTGISPTTTGDTITVNFFQSFYDNSPGVWDGSYGESVDLALGAGAAAASTASGQLCFVATDTDCLALKTLDGPGPATAVDTDTEDLTLGAGNNLVAEYDFTFYFAPGTTNGTSAGGVVPEPALGLPLGLMLLGLAGYAARRRQRASGTR